MHALLARGDHVISTFPGYQSLYELARSIGCEVDLWEPAEQGGGAEQAGWRFDPAGLEALIRPDTKLVVWNFPHNPMGALPSAGDFSRMVDTVARVGAWLFSDEMYRLLEPAPESRLPAAVDLYERAVSLGGMSKAFGLAGLRIGWVVARDQALLERIKSLKDYTTICSSAPSELLALMALRSRESILAANVARVERNLRAAAGFFDRHRDMFNWAPPQAGTVCFPAWWRQAAWRLKTPRLRRAPRPSARGFSSGPERSYCVDGVRLRRFALPDGPGQRGLRRGARGAGRLSQQGPRRAVDGPRSGRCLEERCGRFPGLPHRPPKDRGDQKPRAFALPSNSAYASSSVRGRPRR